MIGCLVVLLALLPIQVASSVLTVGETIEGEITDDDPVVHTETLDGEWYTSAPTVGTSFVLEVDESGPYTIDLRSYLFDAYLVLRDAEGKVLAEDDDGLLGTHARLVAELLSGETYRVDACALHGSRGRFELSLRSGPASSEEPSLLEHAAAERDDAERRLRAMEAARGPDHADVVASLEDLAALLESQGDVAGARALLERALAISERVHGTEHYRTGVILSNLAALLNDQGDLAGARPLYERAVAIMEKVLDPEHVDVGASLNNLALLLVAQGDYAAARPLYERAVPILEKALGPEHPALATSLDNLATILQYQGDYAGARLLFERVLAIREKVLGPEHPLTASSLDGLGTLLKEQGDYAGAQPLYERAFAIRESALGPEHPHMATSLNNLAVLLYNMGDYTGARSLYERALAIDEKALGPEHPHVAASLGNLARLLEAQGDYAGAQSLFERSLAIREKALGPEHPDVALSLGNAGGLLKKRGDYAGARSLFERALAIREKALGPEHPEVSRSLGDLASLLHVQGDYAGARPLYERALAILEKALGPEHRDVAMCLNNLAGLLGKLGDYAGARPLHERAVAICEKVLGPDHPETAASLNNLAGLLRDQGDYAGARPLHERALAIYESALGPEHPDVANGLSNLAVLLQLQGDHAGARPLHERALAIEEKVLGPEHSKVAQSLNNLGMLLRSLGDYAGARPLLERSLAIREQVLGPDHPNVASNLNNLAGLLFDSGEAKASWQLLSRAARGRSGHVRGVLQGLSEAESYRYLSELRWQLELQLSVGSALEEPGATAEGYRGLLEWKGRIARALVASREQLARELDEDQSALVGELRSAQARLSRLYSEEPPGSAKARADHEDQLGELREERNALELELKRSLEGTGMEPVPDVATLASALQDRSAVLDLFVSCKYAPNVFENGELVAGGGFGEDHVSAWVVRAGEPDVVRVDLGPAAELEAATRAHLRRLVSDGVARGTRLAAETGEASDPGEALAVLLWAPLSEHLKGVDTVFVSPDSFLGGLPLETIELEDGRYLVEDVAFVYQQDVSSLASAGSTSTGAMGSLLTVGGVDFGGRAEWEHAVASAGSGRSNNALRGSFTERWSFLPGTDDESRAVHALHEETRGEGSGRLLLQGEGPTEERLKHELPRHSVLHLATHGFFQPEGTPSMWESALDERGQQEMRMSAEAEHLVGKHPGLLSGLVCAGANRPPEGEGDDGYLTAEEVGWLDLSGVELVVMSACETGLGRAESGEGLIGLRRAFRTAGAKTVISSLWSVKDESTAELMRDFYINLWMKGMGRLEALRAAQLAMLRKNRMEHGGALPSTWGAFVLSGEWR